jgi:hypothetical protein
VTAILAFAAAGAGVATYFGLCALMPGDTVESVLVPIVSALVIGCGLFAIWHKVISLVPLLHDPAKRTMGMAIGVGLTAVTIAISSWFIATSIGGKQAVLEHMKSNLTKYEVTLKRASENAADEVDLVADVLRVSAELRALASAEKNNGALSGIKGSGQVVQVLRDAADSYQRLASDLKKVNKNVITSAREAGRLIGELQAVINSDDGSTAEGQRRFSDTVVALQSVITEMDRTSGLPSIKRYGILTVEYTSGSNGQRRAIRNATSSMEQFTQKLSKEAERVEKRRKDLGSISYSPINEGMAAWKYAGAIPVAWAVGVGIDLMPLILLMLMMIGHAEARDSYKRREPFAVVEGGKEAA